MSRLWSGSPWTTTGVPAAPRRKPCAVISFRPAICTFSPWHSAHRSRKMGRIRRSKSSPLSGTWPTAEDRNNAVQTGTLCRRERAIVERRLTRTPARIFSPSSIPINSRQECVNAIWKVPCLCNIERSPFSAWVHCALAAAERARRETGAAANGARREADRERRTVRGHWLRCNKTAPPYCTIAHNRWQRSSDWAAGAAVRAAVFGCATLAHPRRTERPFRHRICDQDAPSLRLGRRSSRSQPSSETHGRDITSSIFSSAFSFARARMPAARGGLQPPEASAAPTASRSG